MKFIVGGIKNSRFVQIKFNAISLEEAKKKASQEGIIITEITSLVPKNTLLNLFKNHQKELIISFRQISLMLEASLPLDEVLGHCLSSCKNPRITQMYQEILKDINAGISLYEAFKKHPNIITPMQVSVIKLGQDTGKLPKIFHHLALEMQEKQTEINKIKKKLFYPLIVLISIFIAFGILQALVIPQFIELFASFNLELPLITRILITAGELIQKYGVFILVISIAAVFGLKYSIKHFLNLRKQFHTLVLKIPFLGKVWFYQDLHQYLFALHLCQKIGMDMQSSLQNAHSSISNLCIEDKFQQIKTHINQGVNLSQAIHQTNLFDSLSKGLILAGEKSGNLDDMLLVSSTHYKNLYSDKLEIFIQWLEPVMTLVVGILVMWFALGIMLPMWDLNDLSF